MRSDGLRFYIAVEDFRRLHITPKDRHTDRADNRVVAAAVQQHRLGVLEPCTVLPVSRWAQSWASVRAGAPPLPPPSTPGGTGGLVTPEMAQGMLSAGAAGASEQEWTVLKDEDCAEDQVIHGPQGRVHLTGSACHMGCMRGAPVVAAWSSQSWPSETPPFLFPFPLQDVGSQQSQARHLCVACCGCVVWQLPGAAVAAWRGIVMFDNRIEVGNCIEVGSEPPIPAAGNAG